MRPLPGGDALSSTVKPRSRKSSVDHPAAASSHVPTAFFMRSAEQMEQSLDSSSSAQTVGKQRGSTYGVQSLADTLETAFGLESGTASKHTGSNSSTKPAEKDASRSGSHSSSTSAGRAPESFKMSPARKMERNAPHAGSTPLTPLRIGAHSPLPTSDMSSTPSAVSLQSLKLDDDDSAMDESASQAIMSSGEEDGEETTSTQQGASGGFPQLVMPSIQMPSRRPFTTKGKAMGKLKVMVAGEAGKWHDLWSHTVT
jgi:hypothetical protein